MKRRIDSLGRIVLPSEMREELNLQKNGLADIEIKHEEIIIKNPMTVNLRESLEQLLEDNEEKGYIENDIIRQLLDL